MGVQCHRGLLFSAFNIVLQQIGEVTPRGP